jgi:hypothetical protein
MTWPELMARLDRLGRRAAIVGPEGSGKTTLLEALAPRLAAQGLSPRMLRLDSEQPRFAPGYLDGLFRETTERHVLLLDGAEQMGRLAWGRLERRSRGYGGLVVATHRPGRLPTLVQCSTSPDLLRDIVGELLAGTGHPMPEGLGDLFARHRGNLRDCLRALYDRLAGL